MNVDVEIIRDGARRGVRGSGAGGRMRCTVDKQNGGDVGRVGRRGDPWAHNTKSMAVRM